MTRYIDRYQVTNCSNRPSNTRITYSATSRSSTTTPVISPVFQREPVSSGMKYFDHVPTHRISFRRGVVPLAIRINAILTLFFLSRIIVFDPIVLNVEATDASAQSNPSSVLSIRLKGGQLDSDRTARDVAIGHDGSDASNGCGRGFALFKSAPRGGARNGIYNDYSYEESYDDTDDFNGKDYEDDEEEDFLKRMEQYRERQKSISSISSGGYNNEGYALSRGGRPSYMPRSQSQQRRREQQQKKPSLVQKSQDWWKNNIDPKLQSLPKIICRIEPTTTLKLRKTLRPLKTIIRLGADYNAQQGIWRFKSSWEDAIIGGKLTLSGNKELQLTKSWHLSVGGVEDLVTRLRFRATINLQTFQAYARVGFRTERLAPIDVVEGFTILKRVNLDGSDGNLKLEVKANVALPEPEIEYSTEAQRSVIGMGNIEVNINELNLLLDY